MATRRDVLKLGAMAGAGMIAPALPQLKRVPPNAVQYHDKRMTPINLPTAHRLRLSVSLLPASQLPVTASAQMPRTSIITESCKALK